MSAPKLPDWAEKIAKRVVADSIDTHYLDIGDGPPLILIHGGGPGADSYGNWKGSLHEYAKHFRVIAYDMPGFGRTARPSADDYAYDQASRNRHLIGLVEALGLKPAHMIGNSMGGSTCLGVAIERPDLVSRLVLMGSAGLAVHNPDPSYKERLKGYDGTLEGMRAIMKAMAGSRFEIDEELLRYRDAIMQDPDARAVIGKIMRSDLTYSEERIASVKHPTLVVSGMEDHVCIPARTLRYLELLGNSWGFTLPHVGHWVMIEAPDLFVRLTTDFLTQDWG